MNLFLRYIIVVTLLLFSSISHAQNLTGCWEGIMDDEYFQLNIEQQNDELCGYTWDTVLNKPNDYCKARFYGRYNGDSGVAVIKGNQFLANTGGHVFMAIRLWKMPGDRKDVLHASASAKGLLGAIFGSMEEDFIIRKISNTPTRNFRMPECFPKPKKEKKVTPSKKADAKKETISTPKIITPPADTIKTVAPAVTKKVTKKDTSVVNNVSVRKKTEQGRIAVNTNQINLKLYDNGVVDNDTVSVFYNGKLLVSHQRLSETPIEINLTLDENAGKHEITLFAENLGGIPPNTALIIVTAGKQRYELHSKASLDENAVLIFDYKKE